MPGNVQLPVIFNIGVDYLCPLVRKGVNRLVHGSFIPRNGIGGEDDFVRRAYLDVFVLSLCSANKCRSWLALTSGNDEAKFVVWDMAYFLFPHQRLTWKCEVAKFLGNAHILLDRSAKEGNTTPEFYRCINRLLYAMDIT